MRRLDCAVIIYRLTGRGLCVHRIGLFRARAYLGGSRPSMRCQELEKVLPAALSPIIPPTRGACADRGTAFDRRTHGTDRRGLGNAYVGFPGPGASQETSSATPVGGVIYSFSRGAASEATSRQSLLFKEAPGLPAQNGLVHTSLPSAGSPKPNGLMCPGGSTSLLL